MDDLRFCPRIIGVADEWKDFSTAIGNLLFSSGASSWCKPHLTSNQTVALEFSHSSGWYRPDGTPFTVFIPELTELNIYGTIYQPRVGPCTPPVVLAPCTRPN